MSETLTHDTSTHSVDTTANHTGEAKIMDMFHDSYEGASSPDSASVSAATAKAIGKAQTSSAHATKHKTKAPSRAITAMKNGVHAMTKPITTPVKNVMEKVRSRTMGLVDRLKAGEKLSTKEIIAIIALVPGATFILGAHYANMFSKKAQAAIEQGKAKWEGFLQSLGLSSDATVHDIAETEAKIQHHEPVPAPVSHDTLPVGETHQVANPHTTAANDEHHDHSTEQKAA